MILSQNMTCQTCGGPYYVQAYRIAKGLGRFCSGGCRNKARPVTAETRAKMSAAQTGRKHSEESKALMHRVQSKLDHSAKVVRFRLMNEARRGLSRSAESSRKTSVGLRAFLRRKAVDGKFKYEVDDYRTRDNLPEYRAWRKAVFHRDNFTCQRCLVRGGQLEAHHKVAWRDDESKRYDVENGITYCIDCHVAVDEFRQRFRKVG